LAKLRFRRGPAGRQCADANISYGLASLVESAFDSFGGNPAGSVNDGAHIQWGGAEIQRHRNGGITCP
jgi:hypothetical protein